MKTMIKYLSGLLALMLILPACQPKEDVAEEITLEVAETSIAFAKDAAEKSITITTNSTSWSYMSPQEGDWLSFAQEGNSLKVKATANPNGTDRSGVIVLLAGDKQKRITVRQSASDATLEVGTESLKFFSDGGVQTVSFTANGVVAVELASAVEWVTLSEITATGFKATVAANPDKTPRSVKVNLTAGTTVREVEIVQDGIMYYVLPILQYPITTQELLETEQARGSIPTMFPDDLFNTSLYRVLTKSKIMPLVQYEIPKTFLSTRYAKAIVVCRQADLVVDNAEFDAFMQASGFAKKEANIFTLDQNGYTFTATVEAAQDGGALVTVVVEEIQTQDYATFSDIPLKAMNDWLAFIDEGKHGKTKDELIEYETSEGSTEVHSEATHILYELAEEKKIDIKYRGYYLVAGAKTAERPYKNEVNSLRALADLTRVYWTDSEGGHVLTREFKALCARNDIKFYRRVANSGRIIDAFYHAATKTVYMMTATEFAGSLMVDFQVARMDLGISSTSIRSVLDKEQYVKSVKATEAKILSLARR